MNVTTIKYGRTVNARPLEAKCFEFERLDVEIIPDAGKTPDEAFGELRAFVDTALANITGATVEKPTKGTAKAANPTASPAKGKTSPTPAASKTAPPLAGKKGSDPTLATSSSPTAKADSAGTEPPFEPGSKVAAEPAPKKRGRPKGSKNKKNCVVPSVDEILPAALKAETLVELLDQFNSMRAVADRTKGEAVESWVEVVTKVAQHRQSFPGFETDPTADDFEAAFAAERNEVTKARAVE